MRMFKPFFFGLTLLLVVTMFLVFRVNTQDYGYFANNYTRHEYNGDFTKIEYVNKLSPYDPLKDSVIFLSSIGTSSSYGKDRSIHDLFEVIKSFKFKNNQVSVGLLIEDQAEFIKVNNYFEDYFKLIDNRHVFEYIHRCTLVNAPFIAKSNDFDREHRQDKKFQRKRRRKIALSRNFCINTVLDTEKYSLFLDADIMKIDHTDMLLRFINSNKDIIVPRVVKGNNLDYDKNSWVGKRTKPSEEQLKLMDSGKYEEAGYTPYDVKDEMLHLGTVLEMPEKDNMRKLDFVMELDSVGGAILFAKTEIYLQGIQFTPNYAVGTTWDREEGYDGIETEGLCYIAKSAGYKCWGFPNLIAQHIVD